MTKHPIQMFFPSVRAIRNLALINMLVLSMVFLVPHAIYILQAHEVGDRGFKYSNSLNYQGYEYWLSTEDIDFNVQHIENEENVRIYNYVRQINLVILGQNQEYHIIPVFRINETEVGYANNTFWEMSLIKVNTNFAYIHLNYEAWQYTGPNGLNFSKYIQDFIIRFQYNNALSLDNIESKFSSLQIIDLQNMDNVSLVETYQSDFYEDAFIGVFRNNFYNDDYWTYLRNDSYHDYFVIATELFGAMDAVFAQSDSLTNPMWSNIRGEYLDLGELQNFIIGDALYNEFGEDLGLLSMQSMKRGHLRLVDTMGTFHFTGESILINEAEGNSTGKNQPEYMAINPISGQFQLWDITPAWDDFDAYPSIIDIGGGEIVMVVYSAEINGYYDNIEFSPDFERTEDYDPVWDWYINKEVQVLRINPLNPVDENYIQFDKSVSGTDAHTIEYPRPIWVETIVNSTAERGTNTAVAITTNDNLYVFVKQYKTESGVTEEIYFGENGLMRTSADQSIIAHSFDLSEHLNYSGYSKIIGPDKDLQDWYDYDDNIEDFEYPEIYGWNIDSIETAFLSDNSIELYFHGFYETVGSLASSSLHRIKINIERELK